MQDDSMREIVRLARRDRVTIYTTDDDAFDLDRWERADRYALRMMIGATALLVIVLILAILGVAR